MQESQDENLALARHINQAIVGVYDQVSIGFSEWREDGAQERLILQLTRPKESSVLQLVGAVGGVFFFHQNLVEFIQGGLSPNYLVRQRFK